MGSYIRCDRPRAIIPWMSEQYDHMMSNTDGGCNFERGWGGVRLVNDTAHVLYSTESRHKGLQLSKPEGINSLINNNNKHRVASCLGDPSGQWTGFFHLLRQVHRPGRDFCAHVTAQPPQIDRACLVWASAPRHSRRFVSLIVRWIRLEQHVVCAASLKRSAVPLWRRERVPDNKPLLAYFNQN